MSQQQHREAALFELAWRIKNRDERNRCLDQACHGDEELRARVLQLLNAADAAGDFLDGHPLDSSGEEPSGSGRGSN